MANVQRANFLGPAVDELNTRSRLSRGSGTKSFNASSITACGRQLIYKLRGVQGVEPPGEPSWTRDADTGTVMHDQYQRYLFDLGLVMPTDALLAHAGYTLADFDERYLRHTGGKLPEWAMEIPLPRNPEQIGGRVDTVIEVKPEHARLGIPLGKYVVELKTVKPKHFYDLRAEALPDGTQPVSVPGYKMKSYKSQATIYMHYLKIPQALIWVINRGDSLNADWRLPYDRAEAERLVGRIRALGRYLDEGTLPPAERATQYQRHCDFCPFFDRCNDEDYP